MAVRADVSDQRQVDEMIRRVVRQFSRLDVLVNNAGITRYIAMRDLDRVRGEDLDAIFAVNVKGAFLCAQAASREMKAAGAGKIINISSNAAYVNDGSSIPYIVSKAALIMLTRCLARALAPIIQVNAIAPGWLATPWLKKYLPAEKQREILEGPAEHIVDTREVAKTVVLFIRNDAVTGQTLVLDGGAGL
jgi:NAD(P)-dependent dehydrogenase (short-subunit alcohol dehydrogenase family)